MIGVTPVLDTTIVGLSAPLYSNTPAPKLAVPIPKKVAV
jgi:hypothetical protein